MKKTAATLLAVSYLWLIAPAQAQIRVRFPERQFESTGWQGGGAGTSTQGGGFNGATDNGSVPGARTPLAAVDDSGTRLLAPQFDAYSRGNSNWGSAPLPPTFGQSVTPGTVAPGTYGTAQPGLGLGTAVPPGQPYQGPGYSPVPPVAFPHGVGQWNSWPRWNGAPALQPARVVQGVRFKHTWLAGDDNPNDLDINDSAISVAIYWPNFLASGTPIYVLPSFALHLWDGPMARPFSTAQLPPRAYSAYIDAQWIYEPFHNPQTQGPSPLGIVIGTRVGIFTDFKGTTTDSLRILGKGLVQLALSNQVTFRLGAYYVDRVKYKVIPAGGLLWTPNENTRFDIFFPEPKLSQKFATLGTTDVWWYMAGEFGGGSWTIERTTGDNDRLDINDVRAIVGFEFGTADQLRSGKRVAFVEAGYVWDREVIYVARPFDSFKPRDTVMVRAGFGY